MKTSNLLLFSFLGVFLFGFQSWSSERTYKLVPLLVPLDEADSGIHFDIAYTAGVHHGIVRAAVGEVIADLAALSVKSAKFLAELSQFDTGDKKRDCHLREALGIDYSHSVYPDRHVCNSDFEIPATGNDSVAFPTVGLVFNTLNELPVVTEQGKVDSQIQVDLTMHGITKTYTVPLHVEFDSAQPNQLKISSQFNVPLSDFGIVVKKFLFITVAKHAVVKVNAVLRAE